MIEGKVIKLGYGDVVIGSRTGYIVFTNITPSLKCGTRITDEMNLGYGESIKIFENDIFDIFDIYDIYDIIETITRDNCIVEHKGYTIDCSNYDEDSVNSLKKHARNMAKAMVFAC